MDLTKLATDAAAEAHRRKAADAKRRKEQDRINDAGNLKRLCRTMLGIDLDDSDLVWVEATGQHVVVVDDAHLALRYIKDNRPGEGERLYPCFLHSANPEDVPMISVMDVSLTVSGGVGSLEDLGKVLAPGRVHSIWLATTAADKRTCFYRVGSDELHDTRSEAAAEATA